LTPHGLYPSGKCPRNPPNRGLSRPQSCSGRHGQEISFDLAMVHQFVMESLYQQCYALHPNREGGGDKNS